MGVLNLFIKERKKRRLLLDFVIISEIFFNSFVIINQDVIECYDQGQDLFICSKVDFEKDEQEKRFVFKDK